MVAGSIHQAHLNRILFRPLGSNLFFLLSRCQKTHAQDIFTLLTDKMKLAVLASAIVGAAAFAPNSVSKSILKISKFEQLLFKITNNCNNVSLFPKGFPSRNCSQHGWSNQA